MFACMKARALCTRGAAPRYARTHATSAPRARVHPHPSHTPHGARTEACITLHNASFVYKAHMHTCRAACAPCAARPPPRVRCTPTHACLHARGTPCTAVHVHVSQCHAARSGRLQRANIHSYACGCIQQSELVFVGLGSVWHHTNTRLPRVACARLTCPCAKSLTTIGRLKSMRQGAGARRAGGRTEFVDNSLLQGRAVLQGRELLLLLVTAYHHGTQPCAGPGCTCCVVASAQDRVS